MNPQLFPSNPSPLSINERVYDANCYDEITQYGTGEDCRRALDRVQDLLGLDNIPGLYSRIEELESTVQYYERESARQEAELEANAATIKALQELNLI